MFDTSLSSSCLKKKPVDSWKGFASSMRKIHPVSDGISRLEEFHGRVINRLSFGTILLKLIGYNKNVE